MAILVPVSKEEKFLERTAKPSGLLKVALEDVRSIRDRTDYRFDMRVWHNPNDDQAVCFVCLAGACMANLTGYIQERLDFWRFSDEVQMRLNALDDFRSCLMWNFIILYDSYLDLDFALMDDIVDELADVHEEIYHTDTIEYDIYYNGDDAVCRLVDFLERSIEVLEKYRL